MWDLTFVYISFAKKNVKKKSRKTVSPPAEFSLKTLISGVRKDVGRMRRSCCDDSSVAAVWIYHCVMIRAVTVCQVHAALPVAW